ncbi:DUF4124 domain-containing protein [Nevskia sp.]|uniref:DUF4124 domain-containing protein n=1 Tax=Nevskia sp. TaxID=1929292 RepID=UPI003F729198
MSIPDLPVPAAAFASASPPCRWPIAALLAALLLMPPASAESRIYRWTDAAGNEHFSDAPPTHARAVKLPAARPAPTAAAPAVDAAACTGKREQLARFRQADRITETNALGETRSYSDDERRRLIATTEADVRAICGED